jgi:two-component system chemotaxis response regulator CheY
VTVDCFSFIPFPSRFPTTSFSVSAGRLRRTIDGRGDAASPFRVKGGIAASAAPAGDDHAAVGRILVAEDSLIVRRLLVEMLTAGGHVVVDDVGDGTDAIRRYGELAPDLVVLDVNMPGCDGFAAAASILTEDPGARVLIASVLLDEQRVERAQQLGVDGVLAKPFETDALLAAVDLALS